MVRFWGVINHMWVFEEGSGPLALCSSTFVGQQGVQVCRKASEQVSENKTPVAIWIVLLQVILPLLKSDLYEVIQSTLDGLLCAAPPVWLENQAAVTVVMASQGYPGDYAKGVEITGEPGGRTFALRNLPGLPS